MVTADDILTIDNNISKKCLRYLKKTSGIINKFIDLEMQNFADGFVDVSNTHDIIENKKNKSTKRITDSHCLLLSNWLRTEKEYRELNLLATMIKFQIQKTRHLTLQFYAKSIKHCHLTEIVKV